ncbi:MAG: RHS repeat domain-containing protein [Anaerolineae bacterium]
MFNRKGTGSSWAAATNLSNNGGSSFGPSVAVDSSDNVHVVWWDNSLDSGFANYEVKYTERLGGTGSWATPTNVTRNQYTSKSPQIAANSTTVNLVWSDVLSGNYEVLFSQNSSGTWAVTYNTPTPSATATWTATATNTPTATPTSTSAPTATPTSTSAPTWTPTVTRMPRPTRTATSTLRVRPLAPVGPGDVEDNSTDITYTISAHWTRTSDGSASGGTYTSSSTTNDTAALAVQGAGSFSVTTLNGPGYGKAYIQLDGTTIDTYDGYNATKHYGIVRGPFNLPDQDSHTVTLKVSGLKNSSSSGYKVSLDKFTVYAPPPPQVVTITYGYDNLYRVTSANYTGAYTATLGYDYDAVGNRTTVTDTHGTVTTYGYDNANRLTTQNGTTTYTWDNNGNLTGDPTHTYTYDQANRLKVLYWNGQQNGPLDLGSTTYYTYNGLGERMSQQVDTGPVTRYVLDQQPGLTQVLSDGSRTYLYGVDRIAQQGTNIQYFGTDGLGSVLTRAHADADRVAGREHVSQPALQQQWEYHRGCCHTDHSAHPRQDRDGRHGDQSRAGGGWQPYGPFRPGRHRPKPKIEPPRTRRTRRFRYIFLRVLHVIRGFCFSP